MGIEQELNYRMFQQREEMIEHVGYEEEYGLYYAVATGNLSYIEKVAQSYMSLDSSENKNNGKLSANPLVNTKYHFVIFTALITRLCVEHGMLREEAYTISDLYINKMDVCDQSKKILYLQGELLLHFTTRMATLEKKESLSLPIMHAIDYINKHLQDLLSLNALSNDLHLNPTYLSHLFKKETGLTFKEYITKQKINASKTMLLHSPLSYSEIAEYYHFSSQSHYINCFKKATNQTPHQYRKNHFSSISEV